MESKEAEEEHHNQNKSGSGVLLEVFRHGFSTNFLSSSAFVTTFTLPVFQLQMKHESYPNQGLEMAFLSLCDILFSMPICFLWNMFQLPSLGVLRLLHFFVNRPVLQRFHWELHHCWGHPLGWSLWRGCGLCGNHPLLG
jgi:hypothetical protein